MFTPEQLEKLLAEGREESLRLQAEMYADAEKGRQAELVAWLEKMEREKQLRSRRYTVTV